MSNQLYIPILNPIHFVPVTPGIPSQYNNHFFDDYQFSDTLYEWQEKAVFFQPWQKNDIIPFQFEANFSGLQLDLQDCYGTTYITEAANQVRANKYQSGFFIYEALFDISSVPDGVYRFILTPAGDASSAQKGQWMRIVTTATGTLLIEYRNSRYHGDVVFETGIKFRLRVPGYMVYGTPASKDQLYEDQVLNETLLSGKPFNIWNFFVGDGSGVPPWLIQKINNAFCCNDVSIDGKSFAKNDGGKWTETAQDGYPLKGYSMDLREGINRFSKIITPGTDPNKKVTLLGPIDSRVFADTSANAGENTLKILTAE